MEEKEKRLAKGCLFGRYLGISITVAGSLQILSSGSGRNREKVKPWHRKEGEE